MKFYPSGSSEGLSPHNSNRVGAHLAFSQRGCRSGPDHNKDIIDHNTFINAEA